MKISKIWSLLKQQRKILVMQGEDCQWISDGFAAYPLYDLPLLTESTAQLLLDVNDKAWDNFSYEFKNKPPFSEADNEINELPLKVSELSIVYRAAELIPLIGGEYIFYIPSKHLNPFSDTVLSFFYRPNDHMIAVKEGLVLRGVINPCLCSSDVFINSLAEIYQFSQRDRYYRERIPREPDAELDNLEFDALEEKEGEE